MGSFNSTIRLDDKYRLQSGRAFMTGTEALVRLLILQQQRDRAHGLNTAGYVSGYRGSPLGGFDQALWKAKSWLDEHRVVFQPGVNEDLALTAVRGTQEVGLLPGARYQGVYGMWYGKGPGLDRSMDALKHANAVGTSPHGGVLAVVGDDHACKSSTLPHQCEHAFMGVQAPVLNPANVQEILDMGLIGWAMSRFSGCWVGLKVITENADAAASVDIDPSRVQIVVPEEFQMPAGGLNLRWPDKPLEQEERLNHYKIYAAREFARVNHLNRVVLDSPNPRLGIVTTGKAYLDVLQALEDLGIDPPHAARLGISVFKVGMPWPLEPTAIHRFAEGLEEILVVEEKRSVIEDQLTGQLYNWPVERRPRVIGECDEHGRPLLPNTGELTPAMVARAIASRIRRYFTSPEMERRLAFFDRKEQSLAAPIELIERPPHFCSGCPHNTSTVVPAGSHAFGGIGCHYMVTWMDRDTQTFTHMGGEGATWLGQAPFTDTPHIFQNLGDGTYFHSGILAIRAAVSAGVNITYKILYNGAVAMTGGQPIDGTMSVEQMVDQLRGEGVVRISVVTDDPGKYATDLRQLRGLSVHHRDDLDQVQRELRDTAGCTILIYDQACAAEKRRKRKRGRYPDPDRRVLINDRVCEGCGDCGVKSNCLSVLPLETPFGRKRMIDQSACNKDFSCIKGFCPSFVSVQGGTPKRVEVDAPTSTERPLPDPVLPDLERPWNVVITGIGGTGVLTISAVLGMAAHLESKGCTVLNLSGLAQKFGPVVSHVRIGDTQEAIHTVRVAAGDADLLLGCDLVVSAGDDPMAKVNAERSHAIINAHASPTAEFLRHPDMAFPAAAMRQRIANEVGAQKTTFVDATVCATDRLGDAIGANLFLLGFAWQSGKIPLSAEAIERAIELNGVEVDFSVSAFRLGREAVVYPESLGAVDVDAASETKTETLEQLIERLALELVDYQNTAWSRQYRETVMRIFDVESRLQIDPEFALTRIVAQSLFKLMSYKDEYEVARLYSAPAFRTALAQQFAGDLRLSVHLAPPLWSKKGPEGVPVKQEFGAWIFRVFRWLAPLKILRGTPLDPFGYTSERKLERALIDDFVALTEEIGHRVNEANYATACELARSVQAMRGFGHVKAGNIARVREQQTGLLRRFRQPKADMIQLQEVAA